jgi:hypothetical protein
MENAMNTQHTPGPWFAGTGWVGAGQIKDGRVIARVDNYPYGNSEANARLIAAAPDLLAAMLDLIQQLEGIGIPDWHGAEGLTLEQARAAIAAAEGKV